jgi:hypothetical protein
VLGKEAFIVALGYTGPALLKTFESASRALIDVSD